MAGDLDNLQGANNWTASDAMCLDIKDYKGDLGEAVIEDPEVDEDDDDGDDAAGVLKYLQNPAIFDLLFLHRFLFLCRSFLCPASCLVSMGTSSLLPVA